jgi:ribokinase
VSEGTVAVVGSLNMDIVVPVPHHPAPGETVLGGDPFRNPGGKGANQAVAAARLGRPTSMVGRVGRDEAGSELVKALRDSDVDASRVTATENAPTGIALITVDDRGENSIVVSPGANARVTEEDVKQAERVVSSAGALLLQLEIPLEAVVAAARTSTGTVILNPAPARPLPPSLLEAVDVLVPNRSELALLSGAGAEPPDEATAASMAARLTGPRAVVVTLGPEGALVVEGGRSERVPAVPVKAVDTTAAGDAFCGALADAMVRREKLTDAARWAVRVAAVACTRRGAQASLPSRDEVLEL